MLFFFIFLALGCSNLLDFSVDLGSPYPDLDQVTFGGLNAYITPGNTPDGFHAADPFNTPSAFEEFTTALFMGTRRNNSGFPSSTFLATRLYGNIHAERFVVPSDDVWTLESVVIPVTCATSSSACAQPGFTSSPEYYQLRVSFFYNNINGEIVSPGGVVKEVDGVFEIVNSSTNVYGHPTHNLRVNFSETIELSAGTYWLGITQVGYAADVISEAKSSNNIMRLAESSLIWGSKWNDFAIGADSRTHNMQEHVDWAKLFISSCPNPTQTFRLNYSTQSGSCLTLTSDSDKLQALQEIMCLAGGGERFSFCYYTDRMRGPRPPGPPFANQTLSGWFPNFGKNPFSLTELKLNVKCVSDSSNFVSLSGRIYQGNPLNPNPVVTSVRPNSTNWDAIGLKADSIICGGLDFEANSTLDNFHLPPRRNTPHPGSFRDEPSGTGRDCYTTVSDSTKWLSSQTYFMMKNVVNMSTGTTDSLGSEIEGAMRDIFFENDLKVMYLYGSCTGSCVGPVTSTSQPSSSSTSTSSTSSASTSSPDSSSSATALVFGLFL